MIILTARVLGWQLGVGRVVGAVLFSVVIGLLMATIFRGEEAERGKGFAAVTPEHTGRPPLQTASYFAVLVLILVFAAWARPDAHTGLCYRLFQVQWIVVAALPLALAYMAARWFRPVELRDWWSATADFAAQILPLLLGGVIAAGLLMGRPGTDAGLLPSARVAGLVGSARRMNEAGRAPGVRASKATGGGGLIGAASRLAHLARLRDAGPVRERRVGQMALYTAYDVEQVLQETLGALLNTPVDGLPEMDGHLSRVESARARRLGRP